MVQFRVNRKYLKLKDSDFNNFLANVAVSIRTKPQFEPIKAKGEALKSKNDAFHTAYLAVLEGDFRQKPERDKLRSELEALSREIADEVNAIANGDEAVITAASFVATAPPSKDRPMGETELLSVEYLPGTNQVKLRCKKADRAVDFQIDVSTDGTAWDEGVDSMPITLFYIYWKKPKGNYFIRLCPRDKDGKRGTPSNQLPIAIY